MMTRTVPALRQYLAAAFLLVIGLMASGCGDSATVNPVVELASLSVNPGTLQPAFSGGTTSYRVDLTSDRTTVTVTAQPAVSGDTVTIDGEATTSRTITLDPPGETTVVNIVVSESTTSSRTYTVRLVRADRAGNNSLENLTVSPGTPPLAFNADTLNYSVTVENTVNSVTVTPTLQDPLATMTVNGQATTSGQARTITPLSPAGQSTTITISVKAQNETEKSYTIVVSRGVSNNNNLSGLSVSPGSLDSAFTVNDVSYTVNLAASLPGNVTSVRVTPTLQDLTARMTVNGQAATSGQPQTAPLPQAGSSTFFNIVVTAQNGTQKTYTVNFIRQALAGNNNLSGLSVSPGPLVPTFTSGNTTYSVDVGSTVTSVRVTPTLDDPAATLTVTSNGPQPITTSGQARTIPLRAAGLSTTINIVVRAPNGSQKPYVITIDRAEPPPPSGNNNLSGLSVSPGPLVPTFTSGNTTYSVDVGSTVTSVRVTPTLDDPTATLTVTSNGPQPITTSGQARTIPLRAAGLSTTINIVVRAPNSSEKPYTITVDRAAPPPPSGNNNLQSLTVSPGTLSPAFSTTRTRTDYAVNDVSSTATSITVTATPQDSSATVTINDVGGNSRSIPLPTGPSNTEIEVRVIAPNGTDKTYLITVNQPAPAAPPAPPANAPDLITQDDSCLFKPGVTVDNATGTNDDCDPNSGLTRDDNFTNVTIPRFQVAPPGAGQTASLYVDGVKAQNASFNPATNVFTLTTPLSGSNDGVQHSITSTVTDTATNLESNQSDPLIVIISTGQSGV